MTVRWAEVKVFLTAQDNISKVIDQVTKRLGVFNKEGIAMGLTFALVNKGIDVAAQTIGQMIDYFQKGIEMNRQFDFSMALLSNTINDFGNISIKNLSDSIKNLSLIFATDLTATIDGLRAFIREGYNAADATKLLFQAQLLATSYGYDLASAQNALSTAMDVFNLEANAGSYVADKFNDVLSNSKLTIEDIDNALSRAANSIRTYGMDFNDIANILYTLSKEGYHRYSMLLKLREVIENWPTEKLKIDVIPTDAVTTLEEKYKKIGDTVAFTAAQAKELSDQWQMKQTGGMDMGAAIIREADAIARAVAKARERGQELPESYTSLARAAEGSPIGAALFGPRVSEIDMLANAYQELDAQMKQAKKDKADFLKTQPFTQLVAIKTETTRLNSVLAENQDLLKKTGWEIDNVGDEFNDLGNDRAFTILMHDQSLAVREFSDEMQQLQRINDAYSLSQSINSLAIEKIQYSMMGTRRGLTRGQKQQIAELERTNMGLQISEHEQQIKIMTIQQTGLRQAQDVLDSIQREHDEDMYSREIRDLDENIKEKNILYASISKTIADTDTQISAQQDLWRNNELIKTVGWANNMHKWNSFAYGASTPGTTGDAFLDKWLAHINQYHAGVPSIIDTVRMKMHLGPIPFLQHGGVISETGLAYLHKGETVIPTGATTNKSLSVNMPITINAVINKDMDIDMLAKKLRSAMSKGLITSTGVTNARMR